MARAWRRSAAHTLVMALCRVYARARRRFVTGVAPGLQNQWMAVRSSAGSTPVRLRQTSK